MVLLNKQQSLFQSAHVEAANYNRKIYSPNKQDFGVLRYKVVNLLCCRNAYCCIASRRPFQSLNRIKRATEIRNYR